MALESTPQRTRSIAAFFPLMLEMTGSLGTVAIIVAGFTVGIDPSDRGAMLVLLALSVAMVMLGGRRHR